MVSSPGALPRGVWSTETNSQRQLPISNSSVTESLLALSPAHVFRRDMLAYCEVRNLIPHPQLLPLHLDEKESKGADPSETSISSNVYDLSEIEEISVKYWQLDDGNCQAMCYALPLSAKVRSVCLFNVQLDKEQLDLICSTIPKTHVLALQLDWISISSEKLRNSSTIEESEPSLVSSDGDLRPPDEFIENRTVETEDQENDNVMQEIVGDEDSSEVFAQLLSDDSQLIFLSLRANGITSRGAAALAKAVRCNKKLETLNLFQNLIDDEGARAFAHALPFNTALKTLSLANNNVSGDGAKFLVDGLTNYPAPPELLAELDAAESRIHSQMEIAKKAKKKIDRATALMQLGLPVLINVDGIQYASGNTTLEELVLSGNVQIGPNDINSLSEALERFQPTLQTHLRCIKLQRLPKLYEHKVQEAQQHVQHISELIKL